MTKNTLIATALVFSALFAIGCGNTAQGLKDDTQSNAGKMQDSGNAVAAATLTPMIKSAILASPSLNDKANEINVDTSDQVVTLSGSVKSKTMKDEAEKITRDYLAKKNAKQTIDNQLVIKP